MFSKNNQNPQEKLKQVSFFQQNASPEPGVCLGVVREIDEDDLELQDGFLGKNDIKPNDHDRVEQPKKFLQTNYGHFGEIL